MANWIPFAVGAIAVPTWAFDRFGGKVAIERDLRIITALPPGSMARARLLAEVEARVLNSLARQHEPRSKARVLLAVTILIIGFAISVSGVIRFPDPDPV